MQESTGATPEDKCMQDQREFLAVFTESIANYVDCLQRIDEIGATHRKDVSDLRIEHKEAMKEIAAFKKDFTPVLDAFHRGLTLKSRVGTIAIIYVLLSFIILSMCSLSILQARILLTQMIRLLPITF